jgi:hypothetical protein
MRFLTRFIVWLESITHGIFHPEYTLYVHGASGMYVLVEHKMWLEIPAMYDQDYPLIGLWCALPKNSVCNVRNLY